MVIGVVGAGAIGTLAGWSLAGEHDVRIVTRSRRAADDIHARGGLLLEGEAVRAVRAAGVGTAAPLGAAIVIVAVKAYDTVEALRAVRTRVDANAAIVSLQNGIEAVEHIEIALGPGRPIALAPTTEAAMLLGAGYARRTARGSTLLGWAQGRAGDERLARLADAMTRCGLATRLVRPVEPYVWAKLVANAAINPLSAVARVTNGALLASPVLRERAACIAREVSAVAAAAQVALPFDDPVAYVEGVMRATAANRSSMLQDVERGRPTEIDALDGAVLRVARRFDIAVPETTRAWYEVRALVKA